MDMNREERIKEYKKLIWKRALLDLKSDVVYAIYQWLYWKEAKESLRGNESKKRRYKEKASLFHHKWEELYRQYQTIFDIQSSLRIWRD